MEIRAKELVLELYENRTLSREQIGELLGSPRATVTGRSISALL